jgi:hypothetical protein
MGTRRDDGRVRETTANVLRAPREKHHRPGEPECGATERAEAEVNPWELLFRDFMGAEDSNGKD